MPDGVAADLAELRAALAAEGPLDVPRRQELLGELADGLLQAKDAAVRAADADFGGRAPEETLFGEVLGAVSALRHARRHLAGWARPRRVPVGLPFWPARAWIVPQPLGVVGVMAPWNYPLLLTLRPLAGALAAGNRVMVKPSEHAPRTAELIARLLEQRLGRNVARTVLGGPDIARSFAAQRFDHLLFTGSTARGREVALAAAANLVPVTLELGGKCPAVILPDADLAAAASAIVTGKGLNAGQTCIAPDHVLLAGVAAQDFLPVLQAAVRHHFPSGLPTRVIPHGRPRIELLRQDGTTLDLVVDPPEDSPLVRDEVFGPILPIHQLDGLDAAIRRLRSQEAPLAVYLFSRDRQAERRLLAEVPAGALVVGGTVLQAAIDALPFGGIGASGMGRHGGRAGFDAMSNLKAHVRAGRFNLFRLGQPPYGGRTRRLLARLLPDQPSGSQA